MKRLSFALCLLVLLSCRSQRSGATIDDFSTKLVYDLYNNRHTDVKLKLDDAFLTATRKYNLDSILGELSTRIRQEYPDLLKVEVIDKQNTKIEGIPAIFVIAKLETNQKFGFYFFYFNRRTNLLLQISQFLSAKDKDE